LSYPGPCFILTTSKNKGGFDPSFFCTQAGAEPVPYFSSPQRTRSLWSLGGPPGPLSPSGFAPIRLNLRDNFAKVAKRGGSVAKVAKEAFEKQTGKKVVSSLSLVRKQVSFRVRTRGRFTPLFFRTQAGVEPVPYFSSAQYIFRL